MEEISMISSTIASPALFVPVAGLAIVDIIFAASSNKHMYRAVESTTEELPQEKPVHNLSSFWKLQELAWIKSGIQVFFFFLAINSLTKRYQPIEYFTSKSL